MTARFKNAYDALVKAYFNDHLEYSDCAMCAVGNIIAHSNGYEIRHHVWFYDGITISPNWGRLINGFGSGEERASPYAPKQALDEIKLTEYSPKEIALIEREFSKLSRPESVDELRGIDIGNDAVKNENVLYSLVEFIASLDGDTLEFEGNPFEKTEELAYEMV